MSSCLLNLFTITLVYFLKAISGNKVLIDIGVFYQYTYLWCVFASTCIYKLFVCRNGFFNVDISREAVVGPTCLQKSIFGYSYSGLASKMQ